MKFAFTDEQRAFRDAVRDLLEKECPPSLVRAAWDDPAAARPAWQRLADMGVVGLLAPEEHGGMGMDEVDLVLLLEETGRAALPGPMVETAAVAVPALAAAGGDWAGRHLPRLVSGEATATAALGAAPLVAHAGTAALVIDDHDGCVHAVEPQPDAVTPRPSVDGATPLFSVGWEATPENKLPGADAELVRDRAALGTAAQLTGLAAAMVETAVEYATQRHQFGRPIGSFQAVQHHLADALLAVEFARPVVYRAAYAVAHDEPERALRVSMAKAYASDAATLAAKKALQVHGAIGYSWEHDLHLWMKRAWTLAAAWGDAAWHRSRIADYVLGGPPAP